MKKNLRYLDLVIFSLTNMSYQEIQEAYEVLSNDEKRKVYDQYGMDGLKEGPHMDADDIFSSFFGGSFFGGMGGMGGRREA